MGLLIRWLVLTAAIIVASYLIQGIVVSGFFSAFFRGRHSGSSECFFQAHSVDFDAPHQHSHTRLFYVYHQCGFA